MDRDPDRRSEKRSKLEHDPADREIRGLVAREFAIGSGSSQQGGGSGRSGRKAPARRGASTSQAGGRGAGRGSGGAAGQGEGPEDDGGTEGKTIPAAGAPETPPHFLEYDASYMRQFQGAPVRRDPVIYNRAVQRQHVNYHGLNVQVKIARAENPYEWLNDKGIDYRFWSLFQSDFYKTVVLAKEKKIVKMKYIDWEHIESMNTPDSQRVIKTVEEQGLRDIMGFQFNWNREILGQFHATYHHEVDADTIHWMTEGVHYKVDFTTFARLLGFGSDDREADRIALEKIKKGKDIVVAYARKQFADGKTVGLKPFYYAMNNLFRETINPKEGDSTSLRKFAANLLVRMAPGSRTFSISRFIWDELSYSMDDARNDLPYAPYIMYIIERVTGIVFKKDVEHKSYKLTQWQHSGWDALVAGSGTAAAAEDPGSSQRHGSSSRPSTSRPKPKKNKLKNMLKNIFCMCQYAAKTAYEARNEINEVKQHLGLGVSQVSPPPTFPSFGDSSDSDEAAVPHDFDVLRENIHVTQTERRSARPQRYTASTHRAGRAVVTESDDDDDEIQEDEPATSSGSGNGDDWSPEE